MVLRINGVVHGRRVELERETGLPDGANVTVSIESDPLPLKERRRRMRALCGAWSADESLHAVFAELAHERSVRAPREIDLDDPS